MMALSLTSSENASTIHPSQMALNPSSITEAWVCMAKPGRASNMQCASTSYSIITVKTQLFRLNQAAYFPLHIAWAPGLGVQWQNQIGP